MKKVRRFLVSPVVVLLVVLGLGVSGAFPLKNGTVIKILWSRSERNNGFNVSVSCAHTAVLPLHVFVLEIFVRGLFYGTINACFISKSHIYFLLAFCGYS